MSEQPINEATAEQDSAVQADAEPVAESAKQTAVEPAAAAALAAEQASEQPDQPEVQADPVVEAATPALAEAPKPEAETAAAEPKADVQEAAAQEAAESAAPNPTAETAEAEPKAAVQEAAKSEADGDASTVVRMLSVGQQVKGTIKRITEFGAFVDIGVGRDGLVHISELSTKRVGKVSDVLQEGQQVDLWIKKLDRERNRISLTMIEPGKRTIRDLQKGEVIEGTVTRILPYGAFIDIGIGRDALLHVREMGEGYIAKPDDVVQVGQLVEVRVIEIARRRSRVDLSMKGLRPEPEVPAGTPSSAATPEARPEPQPEPEVSDEFADMEVLTPMQLAFKRAQEKSGVVLPTTGKQGKNNRRSDPNRKRAMQEEIMNRTLNTAGQNTVGGKK